MSAWKPGDVAALMFLGSQRERLGVKQYDGWSTSIGWQPASAVVSARKLRSYEDLATRVTSPAGEDNS